MLPGNFFFETGMTPEMRRRSRKNATAFSVPQMPRHLPAVALSVPHMPRHLPAVALSVPQMPRHDAAVALTHR